MKKYYSYIIVGMSFVLIVSTIAFYYSYTQNVILDKSDGESINNDGSKDDDKGLQVSVNQETTTNSKTEYELIVEDRQSKDVTTTKLNTPTELIGLSKEQVIEYCNNIMDNPGIEETGKGLIACELVSFSEQKIVIKKVYDNKVSQNKFFIIEENGFVTVYYQDKKSVFEYTQISVNYLNKDEISKLKEGFYVENENMLYSILEGYSS